jgi:hypothetical protein
MQDTMTSEEFEGLDDEITARFGDLRTFLRELREILV